MKDLPNLVEMCFGGEDGGFDQECKYGNRVEQHAVYCHNDKSPYRKCHFGWYTGGEEPDNTCPCFKKNKNFKK